MSDVIVIEPATSSYVITYKQSAESQVTAVVEDEHQEALDVVAEYLRDAIKILKQKRREIFAS